MTDNRTFGRKFLEGLTQAGFAAAQGLTAAGGNEVPYYSNYLESKAKDSSLAIEQQKLGLEAMKAYNDSQSKNAETYFKGANIGIRPVAPVDIQAQLRAGGPQALKDFMQKSTFSGPNSTRYMSDPTLENSKRVQIGVDESGNPIFASATQAKYDQKQNLADDSNWQKFITNNTHEKASSRSTLGMASNANLRAQRARVTLNNHLVTVQDAQNVVADIAGIYAGGAPSDQVMSHSEYNTLKSKLAATQQSITGLPTDSLSPKIKTHLIGVLDDLQGTNNDAIKRHLSSQEKANAKLISKHKKEWDDYKSSLFPEKSDNSDSSKVKPKKDTLGLF